MKKVTVYDICSNVYQIPKKQFNEAPGNVQVWIVTRRYEHDFKKGKIDHCVCQFHTGTFVKENGRLWVNENVIKFLNYDTDFISQDRYGVCPICERSLPARERTEESERDILWAGEKVR